jgi:hypothetical protein
MRKYITISVNYSRVIKGGKVRVRLAMEVTDKGDMPTDELLYNHNSNRYESSLSLDCITFRRAKYLAKIQCRKVADVYYKYTRLEKKYKPELKWISPDGIVLKGDISSEKVRDGC